ncbi:MAG: phage minor head protein [Candidatus Paceibacterota bacterium]
MEEETRRRQRALEDVYSGQVVSIWGHTLKEMRASITEIYRQDFGKETWDITSAYSKGTLARIGGEVGGTLAAFKVLATKRIMVALSHIREEERLRALWMIDQATPGSYMPKVPYRTREADTPRDAKATWQQTLDTWTDTYHTQLVNNLRMEALHEGDIHDAADEPASTRIDNFDPEYKLRSMFAGESIKAEADARRAIYDENDEVLEEEIWVTMEDSVVCPICAEYDGKPLSEVQEDIPAHYNCRCYTRFVPRAWADMLRSGDPDDREMALKMDDAGLVPDSMAIRSEKTGAIIGRAIVTFEEWKSSRGMNIMGAVV